MWEPKVYSAIETINSTELLTSHFRYASTGHTAIGIKRVRDADGFLIFRYFSDDVMVPNVFLEYFKEKASWDDNYPRDDLDESCVTFVNGQLRNDECDNIFYDGN